MLEVKKCWQLKLRNDIKSEKSFKFSEDMQRGIAGNEAATYCYVN